MSSPSTPTIPEIITPTSRARDPPVITPFHNDPYMIVRRAYTPIAMDIKSDPFEDPIETEETHPLSPRAAPLSPDYYPSSPDYTPNTSHSDEELEPMEASETRTVSPSDSTSPLSPDHPLTQTSPTPTPSRVSYCHSTTCMAVRTQPTLSPGISAKLTEAMALSPTSFSKRCISSYETSSSSASPASSPTFPIRKRYRGTSEPILDTETEGDELKAEGTGSESEESKDEGPGSKSKEAASKGQQQSVPEQQRVDETPTPRLPTRPIWVDPEDDTVYIDIEFDAPPVHAPFQTPTLLDWSSGSLLVSPASLTVSSPVASLVTTPAATITVDEDEFLEGYGRDFTRLFARSEAVCNEIHSQCFRLGSLERGQEHATISFGALWRPVLALEAWAGETDAQRAALWQARYEDQRDIHALRMHSVNGSRCRRQGLRERVATLEQRMDRLER
ncbi:hypothetical protein Tco_0040857 [Tanacetum coccineum]